MTVNRKLVAAFTEDPEDLKLWKFTLTTSKGVFVRDFVLHAFDETHAILRARLQSANPEAAFAGYHVTIEEVQ